MQSKIIKALSYTTSAHLEFIKTMSGNSEDQAMDNSANYDWDAPYLPSHSLKLVNDVNDPCWSDEWGAPQEQKRKQVIKNVLKARKEKTQKSSTKAKETARVEELLHKAMEAMVIHTKGA